MPTYIPNITDKQQNDIESAANSSAIRVIWFDGKEQQTGETKFVRAYDLNAQGNTGSSANDAMRMVVNSGSIIGSHNDKPAVFETPGKA